MLFTDKDTKRFGHNSVPSFSHVFSETKNPFIMKYLVLLALAAVAYGQMAPLHTDSEPIPGAYIIKVKVGQGSQDHKFKNN